MPATLTRVRLAPVGILGLGHCVPDQVLSNSQLESKVDTSDQWIRSRTGICERRIAPDELCSSDLGFNAAQQALEQAGLRAEEVELIIVATLTPDSPMPSTACRIQQRLGATRAGAFDLSVACSGFTYALCVGQQFVASGTYTRVLVVGVDTLSRITNWEDRSTCVLFGDAAGAAVLGPVPEGSGILGFHFGADGSGGELLHIPAGAGAPSEVRTDHCIHMAGRGVYRFAVQAMGEASIAALEKSGISPEEVSLFIPHQANLRIIEAAARRLNISMDRVFTNVDRYGNTSNGSVPLALWEAQKQGRIHSGDIVVTVGFGGGLAWCALVMRWL
ncbi:MAG: ketoacyl-ACP synthase III [Candidatus Eremiobacteraeota bacterium]|nr:ketoacyl-ACP synthase III [Candidatus Eremiobacteraeota bacterium]